MDASLGVRKERDPKGLYAKAERGEIKQFTGIDSPYEAPAEPEVRVDADRLSVPEGMNLLLDYLHGHGILKAGYPRVEEEVAG